MKKTFILATILGALISAPAFAKSEGNYAGIDLIGTNLDNGASEGSTTDNTSFGVSYKYAFNFDKVFIAPGVFYDYNSANASTYNSNGSPTGTTQNKLRDTFGFKVDFGYDLTDRLSPFVTLGRSIGRFDNRSNFDRSTHASSTEQGTLYGLGLRYALNEDFDLNVAYERTKYDLGNKASKSVDNIFSVARLGVAYKF